MSTKAIAIVDDDPDLVNIFSEALQTKGYAVSSFTDSHLAYEHMKENPGKYSLLITDDKIDGLFLSTKLLEVNPKLKIILFSDFSDLHCEYEFNILKKPVSILKLISAVNDTLVSSILYDNKS